MTDYSARKELRKMPMKESNKVMERLSEEGSTEVETCKINQVKSWRRVITYISGILTSLFQEKVERASCISKN